MRISDWSSDVCSSDLKTEGKPDLAAGGAGQELAERHEIGVAGLVDPFAAHHQLVAEVTEMGDRAAERSQPELEEGAEHLAGRSGMRSEEHTSELQSLMRSSYAVFSLKKKKK